jgi:Ca2+-binding RTX toxin-like protein
MKGSGLRLGGSIAVTAGLALMLCCGTAAAAVTADPAVTILYVKGDAEANQIQVDCGTGIVLLNGAPAADGHANCADLKKLEVFGFGGDDTISLTGFPKHSPGEESGLFGEYGKGNEVEIAALGGDGNDSVAGDASAALYSGGEGDDSIRSVNSFIPALLGGPGNDTIASGSILSFMFGGGGNDHLISDGFVNFALGGDGADLVSGSPTPDLADGGEGPDTLVGNGGPDFLIGEAGKDSLFGGTGPDLLVGSGGRDDLRGGPGADIKFQSTVPKRKLNGALDALSPGDSGFTISRKWAHKLLRLASAAPAAPSSSLLP